jgi:hypothetical protein
MSVRTRHVTDVPIGMNGGILEMRSTLLESRLL